MGFKTKITTLFLGFGLVAGLISAHGAQARSIRLNADLKAYLQKSLSPDSPKDIKLNGPTHVAVAIISGKSGPVWLAYVSGGSHCNHGCELHFLEQHGHKINDLGTSLRIKRPIVLLKTKTKGYSDLAVFFAGGGPKTGYVKLQFDGQHYPSDPSQLPLLTSLIEGGLIINTDNDGEML